MMEAELARLGQSTFPAKETLDALLRELAPAIARDPRARATIRVGAIGHRVIDPAAGERLAATARLILDLVRQAAEETLASPRLRGQFAEGFDLAVISPLAEGADRVIAKAGLDQNCKLGAVLPFSAARYEATFDIGDRTAAIAEFRALLEAADLPGGYGVLTLDGGAATEAERDVAFLKCAQAVTRWSDILIAILSPDQWASQTGLSVREAAELGVLVVLVDPARPGTFQLVTRTRTVADADAAPTAAADPVQQLKDFVASLLAPPARHNLQGHAGSYGLAAYREEKIAYDASRACDFEHAGPFSARTAAPFWVRWCSGLNRWIEKRIEKLLVRSSSGEKAGPFLWDLPFEARTAAPAVELFLRYQRADAIASAYAELHRSMQIVVVILSVATGTFAALGMKAGAWAIIFSGLELISLGLALSFVWISHRQGWLERWLDCRLLAEIFRYSKFLLLAGRPSPFPDGRRMQAGEDEGMAWTRHHAEAILRAQCLAVPGHGAGDKGRAAPVAAYIAAQCIADQARYHEKTGRLRLKQNAALKAVSVVVSAATVAVVAGKFGLEIAHARHLIADTPANEDWRRLAEVMAIVFPALTAGLLALRAFGEHNVVGLRSIAIKRALDREKQLLGHATGIAEIGNATHRAAAILLHDVDGWRDLFSGKHLES